ncbi:hypothetical protein HKX48_007684 [Thoreauomyces humboldtii]|nr:hypothetical protein HKX48_007684 [Thoreauomyces humboldtii]
MKPGLPEVLPLRPLRYLYAAGNVSLADELFAPIHPDDPVAKARPDLLYRYEAYGNSADAERLFRTPAATATEAAVEEAAAAVEEAAATSGDPAATAQEVAGAGEVLRLRLSTIVVSEGE